MKYQAKGTCCVTIDYDIVDGKVSNVVFTGGCAGNHLGIAQLVEGMKPSEVIAKLEGIKCGFRDTSCPDQLAQALKANQN